MDFNPDHNEENDYQFPSGRDGHVLLVDCSKQMYDTKRFFEAIEIIEALTRNMIIKNEKNLFGVLFYNTEKSPSPFNEKESSGIVVTSNIACFLNLKSLSADVIKYINDYKENDLEKFPDTYGHCVTNPDCLNDAFWIASKMLRNCGYKLRESRILLFTDNAKPFQSDSPEERNAFKKAEDLRDSGITVTVIPMSDTFNGEMFYSQFLANVYDCEVPEIEADLRCPSQTRENLLSRCFRKEFTKRCNARVKFHFGQGLEMSVGLYSMYREAKPPRKVTLKRDDHEVLQRKQVAVVNVGQEDHVAGDAEMHENSPHESKQQINLMPMEVKKYQRFGEEKVIFTMQEYTQMKRVMTPGVTLLGFKPESTFCIGAHLRGPNFMYPDETILKGSTTLFRALWEKCLERKKVAYAILVESRQANPKLVVLVPQTEQTGRDGKYQRYGGFRVEYIPYSDYIRDIKALHDQPIPEVTDETVELFKKIIKPLKFRYCPSKFNNPAVRGIYDVIEATVLEKPQPEFEDTTLPDDEAQDNAIAHLVDSFNELFTEDVQEAKKRPNTGVGGSAKKVAKTYHAAEIEEAANNGTLKSYTVDILKAYLTEKNVSGVSKLKKAELIEKVKETIEDQLLAHANIP